MKAFGSGAAAWLVFAVTFNGTWAVGQSPDDSGSAKVPLPYNDHLLGADGFPDYVDDATVQAKLPWLKDAGPRLNRCLSGMTIPQFFTVTYPPRIDGPHRASTRT